LLKLPTMTTLIPILRLALKNDIGEKIERKHK
jgi:hypothetical protein